MDPVNHDTILYGRGVWLRVERSTGNLLLDIPDENGKPSTTNVIVPKSAVRMLREAFELAEGREQ